MTSETVALAAVATISATLSELGLCGYGIESLAGNTHALHLRRDVE